MVNSSLKFYLFWSILVEKITSLKMGYTGAMFSLINKGYAHYTFLVFHPVSQITALIILLSFGLLQTPFVNIDTEIYSIISAIWISNTAFNQKSFISVKSKILYRISEISYGICVYHFIIIYIFGRANVLQQFPAPSYFIV